MLAPWAARGTERASGPRGKGENNNGNGSLSSWLRWSLPIDTVEVINGNAAWLGATGAQKAWSTDLQRWQGIRDFFHVKTFQPISEPCLGVYYPELKAACVKLWEPADRFPVVEAWTWGESYKSVKGSGPYFGVSSAAPKIKVKPQEKIGFTIYFAVLHDVAAAPTAEDLYAAAQEFLK